MYSLKGPQHEALAKALQSAFPSYESLERMVHYRLDRNLQAIAMGDSLSSVVFKLIRAAQAEGWIDALIARAREANSGNPDLAAFCQRLGLSPASPHDPALESLIRQQHCFLDVNTWRLKLGELENQVCRVEITLNDGSPAGGTGFLVGTDLLLTNYHVIQPVIEREELAKIGRHVADPEDVALRFDYKVLPGGHPVNPGTVYRLADKDWLVDASPPSQSDYLPSPTSGDPKPDELDYALLRVHGAPGKHAVGSNAEPGACPRGWVKIIDRAHDFSSLVTIMILQHPQGSPLKLAMDTSAEVAVNTNETRISYKTNTEPGSSGSPCFNINWELVALHHCGDPKWVNPAYNQGVPINAIVDLLRQRGKSHLVLGDSLPKEATIPIAKASPPSSVTDSTHQRKPALPPSGPCFGRDDEVERLVTDLLSESDCPVFALGGPGIGKTTLTLKALHDDRIARRFGDSRFFVRCDGLFSCQELVSAIRMELGLQPHPDPRAAQQELFSALSGNRALLTLDNLETPWHADTRNVEQFLDMLAAVPDVTLAASIRAHDGPRCASSSEPITLPRLKVDPAKDAFLDIAGDKFSGAPRLDDLLKELDGLPLAIHLMAHQARTEPDLEGIWLRWNDERTSMLDRVWCEEDRLSSLNVSLRLSVDGPRMQDDPENLKLLSVLGMLPEGMSRQDIPKILPQGLRPASSLVKIGLAFYDNDRLRMLAPVRQYVAADHLPDPAVAERVINFFMGLVNEHADNVGREGGAEAVRRLTPEASNVEALFPVAWTLSEPVRWIDHAVDWGEFVRFTGLGSPKSLDGALALSQSLGATDKQAACLQKLGDIALDRSDHNDAREKYQQALPLYKQVGDILGQANSIRSLGDIALRRSDHNDAREKYQQALPLYKQVGDILGQANSIRSLGDIALRRSDHNDAREKYQQALPLYKQVGDILGQANSIRSLGDIALDRSDHNDAREKYQQALPLYKQVGDILGQANSIRSLGDIALRRSDHNDAREKYQQALPLYKQVGDILGQANCIQSLGDIALDRSDHNDAREKYQQALPLYKQVGDILGQANCIKSLGDIALRRSDHNDAREKYQQALPLYKQVGSILGQANSIKSLGDIALRRSDHNDAREKYQQALPLYKQVGDILGQANCIQRLGDIALRRSDHNDAREKYQQALPLYKQVGSILGQANSIKSLGDIALDRSDHNDAREKYQQALPLYKQVGDILGQANSIRSLGDIALANSHQEEAIIKHHEALGMYQQIPEPYSIGWTYRRLARIAPNEEKRAEWVSAAKRAWQSIDRPDLVQDLEREFADE